MNNYESNGCTSKSRQRTLVVLGAGVLCVALGATTEAAMANQLPGPAPALMWADATSEPGPPNYPEYDPRYEVEPLAGPSPDGIAAEWLPAGASTLAVIGVAGGIFWLYRRRIAAG